MRKTLPVKEFFVDPNIDRAESLPASAFVDPEFLELELGTIFAHTWLLAPRENDSQDGLATSTDPIGKTGSRFPFNLLGKPFFLQRGQHGRLNCFPNVCTHAWHPLVGSSSVGGAIICPQHGRQFDNEGRFVAQAGFEKVDGFPRESDHLRNVHVDEWGQWVFVSTSDPLAPFREFIETVQQSVPGIKLASLRRHRFDGEVREVDGNWKQHAWNYMDNFHIKFVHKGPGGLADAIDLSSYRTELYKFSALQWAYARDEKNGFDPQLLADRFLDPKNPTRKVFALWWFIFPNITLNFYPWGLSVNVYMPISGKPDKTLFLWFQYALDEEKFQRRNSTWLSDQVDAEDIEAIGLVNTGAKSGFAPRGRFAPSEETGPHWFHRLAYETIFEHRTPIRMVGV
ncbi:Rieske 2Fe-2S domain-containing protein [Candidatus Bathyarchaeota archaeon]|nr:MAG: Rieske 2Fe-2S domain-containing protein [Candidatus Bathyarchaeota archaeon]